MSSAVCQRSYFAVEATQHQDAKENSFLWAAKTSRIVAQERLSAGDRNVAADRFLFLTVRHWDFDEHLEHGVNHATPG